MSTTVEHSNLPVDVRQRLEKEAAEMVKRIGSPGGDFIRLTRKKTFKLPNGQESAHPLRVVVLDFVAFKAFYDRPFSEDEKTPPACFALGRGKLKDMSPHESAPAKQSETCADCPNNEFGSKGKGKACGDHYVLAVVEPSDKPDAPVYLIKLSPTATRPWDAYVTNVLSAFGRGPIAVSTEIFFDPDDEYPTLRFGDPKPNEHLLLHLGRQEAATKRLMTTPDVSNYEAPKAKPAAKPKK